MYSNITQSEWFLTFQSVGCISKSSNREKRMIFCHRLGTLYVLLTGMCLFVCVYLCACTCMQGIYYIYIYMYLHIISYTCIYLHILAYTCIYLHICNYILILIYLHTPVSHPYARCWSYSFVTHNIKSTFIPVS